MKIIIAILSSAAAVIATITFSGQHLDAAVLFSTFAASSAVGLLVHDYRQPRSYLLEAAPKRSAARARQAKPAGTIATVTEFATLTGFDTFAA